MYLLIATQISAGSFLGRAPFYHAHRGCHLGLSKGSFALSPGGTQEAGCEPQEAGTASSCALASQLACCHEGQMHMNMEHTASCSCSVCRVTEPLIQFPPRPWGWGWGLKGREVPKAPPQGHEIQSGQAPAAPGGISERDSFYIQVYFLVEDVGHSSFWNIPQSRQC